MKKKYSKELFKKWMEPDKELDKRLRTVKDKIEDGVEQAGTAETVN